ncbi:ATPase P [Tamilnaduibacter salinus]|uniref:ATPase P n=1 Tax=Tamilnaduibacter salinus TaxID=1484056 RepID=A0A2A2I420_9GAMM|nr:heavy metal translocating P-type ATPase [Tamilnaduibacter salinus]PAV26761.1 ATPase P [Tamilnaduibacter salinus]
MATGSCYHCDEPLTGGAAVTLTLRGEPRSFCCEGCRAVCQLIIDEDLDAVYRYRTAPQPTARTLTDTESRRIALYDHELVQRSFVSALPDGKRREASLLISGISCAACIWLLEHHLGQQHGVEHLTVNHTTHRASLIWYPDEVALSDLFRAIHELGYDASPWDASEADHRRQQESRSALIRLCVAGIGGMQSMMLAVPLYFGLIDGVSGNLETFFRWVSLLVATPVVLYSARPFFRNAWRDLRTRHLSMDVPVALAIGLAYSASAVVTVFGGEEVYFESVCMFTFFLSLGRYIEMQARHRAGLSDQAAGSQTPTIANRINGQQEAIVSIYELTPGDHIRLYPGDTIPVDGEVVSGQTTVNEAALTGEYVPVSRQPGDVVHAGTVNGDQPLVIAMTRAGAGTRLAGILRIMDRVQAERPRAARVADRVAAVFVGTLLVVAPLVGLGWWLAGTGRAFDIMLAVLVATCPCALSLATPTALTSATNALRRRGFLPARGHTLESLATIDTVVFDKTGTLTQGSLTLTGTDALANWSEDDCLSLAAALEVHSEHPVAQAFKPFRRPGWSVDGVRNHVAGGLSGQWQGQTVAIGHAGFLQAQSDLPLPDHAGMIIGLTVGNQLVARFHLDDRLRPDAIETVQALTARGLETHLLSGDRSTHVAEVAQATGIHAWRGECTPEDKLNALKALEHQGHRILMVGDGLNDLPVMAGAHVSVALGRAADLTQLQADAILLRQQLASVPEALTLARRTRRTIRQNLGWALGYNITALPLAAAGIVPPWLAALGMSASSLVVVLNALRLGMASSPGAGYRVTMNPASLPSSNPAR